DVAEEHGAAHSELSASAFQLPDRCRGIVERQGSVGGEAPALFANDTGKRVVDERGEASGIRGGLDVRSGGGERNDLGVDAGFGEHALAIVDIAMAANGDVVIAGVVEARIAVIVHGDAHVAGAGAKGVDV